MPDYMYLNSISQAGDVVLVEDENVFETVDLDAYTPLVNSEVITETGEPLGRVRDFQFNLDDGKVSSIIIASLGYPQIPDQLISTYELSMEEVISSGPNRLIVFEGAEERLTQLTVGVLERLGIGRPAWEKQEEEMYYPPTTRPENQLGTGIPIRTPLQVRQPVMEERWNEDDWEESRPAPPPLRRQAETIRYEEDNLEEDNWGESKREAAPRYVAPRQEPSYEEAYSDNYQGDVWDDDAEPEPYNPPRINIPEKKKERITEYYEE